MPEQPAESTEFDRTWWDAHYQDRHHHGPHGHTLHTAEPSPYLTARAGELAPGTALDAGCGEGADAVWLAARGWRVTAVDLADAALGRARDRARNAGEETAARIDWQCADLTAWTPPRRGFDLVTTHYVHAAESREVLFGRLAEAVAPGGSLLVVGHHPADPEGDGGHASLPGVRFTAEEAAAVLDPERWDILAAESPTRTVTRPDGQTVTMRDSVLHARRRR
ncbi:class I SAM-dependent methyltransferase [Streptomyces sp. HNM0574]|uniref:class I SAM-dependent methyltransferase n=1 Tax=Streptomyces sp. HNM0574 TaxID=2714954 RepID=UPI00146F1A9D|nr:class I SAM-dependent methyltransferase [Streptomyces sp. HNM0574]NLU70601.1 class I SAM-dependent methyltransferase [Streptomyces sp. HNM0574]